MASNYQLAAVFDRMVDGEWRTLRSISQDSGYPEASISARLRDIRKVEHYRRYTMESCQRSNGTWVYRVIPAATRQSDLPLFRE